MAILREPASFLRSLHLQLLQTHVEGVQDFRTAISLEGERREGRRIPRRSHRPQLLQYGEHVRYVEQLRRYHEVFSTDQVLVLIYDDFRADNEAPRGACWGCSTSPAEPLEAIEANPSVRCARRRWTGWFTRSRSGAARPAGRPWRGQGADPAAAATRRLRVTQQRVVHAPPPAADERFMNELRRRLCPEVQPSAITSVVTW